MVAPKLHRSNQPLEDPSSHKVDCTAAATYKCRVCHASNKLPKQLQQLQVIRCASLAMRLMVARQDQNLQLEHRIQQLEASQATQSTTTSSQVWQSASSPRLDTQVSTLKAPSEKPGQREPSLEAQLEEARRKIEECEGRER